MFKLIGSAFKRLITAITSPFRLLIVKISRTLNFNVISAKLIGPLTKKVRSLITLKPQSWKDYYKIGKRYVYKKLFLTIVLVICAAIFIVFTIYMPAIPKVPETLEQVVTDVEFMYNDMALKDYEGVANIRAANKAIVYTGDVAKGVATGTGTLRDKEGRVVYAGGFLNNQYEGSGVQYYPASGKVKYEGGFAGGSYSGQGKYYDPDGNLLYTGEFAGGLYEGAGQSYDTDGKLVYEGQYVKGLYHGSGMYYYKNGVTKYQGEFFEGAAQGSGSLFSQSGKLLYTGAMYGGTINYRALLHTTLEDIDTAFTETPVIYYADSDCVFVYEQAGCALTVNCAVRMYEEANVAAAAAPQSSFFFFPDGTVTNGSGTIITQGGESSQVTFEGDSSSSSGLSSSSTSVPESSSSSSSSSESSSSGSESSSSVSSSSQSSSTVMIGNTSIPNFAAMGGGLTVKQLSAQLPPLFIEECAWEVTGDVASSSSEASEPSDGADPGALPSSSAVPEASAPPSGTTQEQIPNTQGAVTQPSASSSESSSQGTVRITDEGTPDFVEATYTLYYEIDTGVWQSEDKLDKSKVQVDSVLVFNGDEPVPLEDALEYENNDPPTLGDCVAVTEIRNTQPTAFSNIVFETNSQMRLVVEVSGINYAGLIIRKAYTVDDMTYLYCYQFGDEEKQLMYYVIEG